MFWMGQNDRETEGVWRYVNGSSHKCNRTAYLRWIPNMPAGPGRRKNCAVYVFSADAMKEAGCDLRIITLCKVKLTSGEGALRDCGHELFGVGRVETPSGRYAAGVGGG